MEQGNDGAVAVEPGGSHAVTDAGRLTEAVSVALPGRQLMILSNEPDLLQKSPRSTERCPGVSR